MFYPIVIVEQKTTFIRNNFIEKKGLEKESVAKTSVSPFVLKQENPHPLDKGGYLVISEAQYEKNRYERTQYMNMTELEESILESGFIQARALMQCRLEQDPRGHAENAACPACRKKLRIQDKEQRRTLKTMMGEVTYQRAYGVCDGCGWAGAPLDEALRIPRHGPSIGTCEKVCHASVVGRSFDDGRELLEVQARLPASRKHVRELSEKEGARLVRERATEVDDFQKGAVPVCLDKTKPELLVVTCDGGRVQTIQPEKKDRWREDKIGVVYDAVAHPSPGCPLGEYEGAKARIKTSVATLSSWEEMGWMLRVEAEKRGYGAAKEKVFVADGARTIRALKDFHFPEAVFVLDWPHALGHLSDCAKAAFGEGTSRAVSWYEKNKRRLWDGKIDEVIDALKDQSKRLGLPTDDDTALSPRVLLHRAATSYFPGNRDAMNYPLFREKGWPIGSGVAEGAVKQFALRMKGSEKFWNVRDHGAEEMLALCALYHCEDGRWYDYWRQRAGPGARE